MGRPGAELPASARPDAPTRGLALAGTASFEVTPDDDGSEQSHESYAFIAEVRPIQDNGDLAWVQARHTPEAN